MMRQRLVRTTQRLHRVRMPVPLLPVLQHPPLAAGVTVHRLQERSTHLHQVDIDLMMLPHRQLSAAVLTTHRHPLWQLLPVQQPTTEDLAMKRARLVLRLNTICGLAKRKEPSPATPLHNNLPAQNQHVLFLFFISRDNWVLSVMCVIGFSVPFTPPASGVMSLNCTVVLVKTTRYAYFSILKDRAVTGFKCSKSLRWECKIVWTKENKKSQPEPLIVDTRISYKALSF